MLTIFQLELDKPQSVLFTIGFSFQDKHIAKMIIRALQNPEFKIYVFAYDENDKKKILHNLGLDNKEGTRNLKIIVPKDLESGLKTIVLEDLTKIFNEATPKDANDDEQ